MLKLKSGVRVLGVRSELVIAIHIASAVCEYVGVDCTITAVIDGTHKRASEHYSGCAFDLRRPDWPDFNDTAKAQAVADELKQALGDDYDVILEKDHIHIEFQPKTAY